MRTNVFLLIAAVGISTGVLSNRGFCEITMMQVPSGLRLDADPGSSAVSADGRTLMLHASSTMPVDGQRVLIWDVGSTITQLQAPGSEGYAYATSTSLSADGNRVVLSDIVSGHWSAFLWDRASGYWQLGSPIAVYEAEAGGISRNGLWASGARFGWIQQLPMGGDPLPAVVCSSIPPGPWEFSLRWISDDGLSVAGSGYFQGDPVAYWGYPPPAPPHPPAILYSTRARWFPTTITADGIAVGYTNVNGEHAALLATAHHTFALPGPSTDPQTSSELVAAAAGGAGAVGHSVLPNVAELFWYWNPEIGTVPLGRVIDPLPEGLHIDAVLAMTDDGQKVVGYSEGPGTIYPQQQWVWIASINVPGCANADYNADGEAGTDADIEDFFACLSGTCCFSCVSADFNADGVVGDNADIEAFFRVLAGGGC